MSTESDTIANRISRICDSLERNDSLITVNTVTCTYEEQFVKEDRTDKRRGVPTNIIPNYEIQKIYGTKFVNPIFRETSDTLLTEEKQQLEQIIKGLPDEMVLYIDEFGYQLTEFSKNVEVIEKLYSSKKYIDQNSKLSSVIVCFNKKKEYLKPFIKCLPLNDYYDDLTKQCLLGNEIKNTQIHYYTCFDFKNWFSNVVCVHAHMMNKKFKGKKTVIVLDKYYEKYNLRCDDATIFYHSSSSHKLNVASEIIQSHVANLRDLFYKKGIETYDDFRETWLYETSNFIRMIFCYLDEASKQPIVAPPDSVIPKYNFGLFKEEKRKDLKSLILGYIHANKCVTVDTVRSMLENIQNNDGHKIHNLYVLTYEEIKKMVESLGFQWKRDTCDIEYPTYTKDHVESFVLQMMEQNVPIENTIFIDFYDYRLCATDIIEMVDGKNNKRLVVSSDTKHSFSALGFFGDGHVLPPLVCFDDELYKLKKDDVPSSKYLLFNKPYITEVEMTEWLKSIAESTKRISNNSSNGSSSSDPKTKKRQKFVIVAPSYFKKYLMLGEVSNKLNENNISVVYIHETISSITPLSDLIGCITNSVLEESKHFDPTSGKTILERRDYVLWKIQSECNTETINVLCWPWKFYKQSNQFDLCNMMTEVRRRKETYDNEVISLPRKYSKHDLPYYKFNLTTVPQIFRPLIKKFLSSEKFLSAQTASAQLDLLNKEFGKFNVIKVVNMFQDNGSVLEIIKRTLKE